MQESVGLPLRVIHIFRNPFDNIATMFRRYGGSLDRSVKVYFRLAGAVSVLKESRDDDIIDMSHESILSEPEKRITELCGFLGVDPAEDYLRDCAAKVWKSPNRSRDSVQWTAKTIDRVARGMDRFPWLAEYSREP